MTRSARKHKLANWRIREALASAVFSHMDGDMALYNGTDSSGLEIELGVVRDDRGSGFAVVHAPELEEEAMTKKHPPEGFPESFDEDVTVRGIDLDREEFIVGGEQFTEERAAALAERAEPSAGRPSLTAPGRRSPTLNLRVPAATRESLDRLAEQQGRRPSEVVRDALEEYLTRHAS